MTEGISGITIILSNLLLIKVEARGLARVEVRGLARAGVSLEVINDVILIIFIYYMALSHEHWELQNSRI